MQGELDEDAGSPEVFRARVISVVNDIVDRRPGNKVAIVCHGGVINQYVAYVLGITTPMGSIPGVASIVYWAKADQNRTRLKWPCGILYGVGTYMSLRVPRHI